ncbi:hypothetical protein AFK69_01405 [Xenorhabdus sp. GDc328]|nr:hypothetical protein AAY47_17465 [Xenorhabdus griffiniae]KOP35021.1 hypothetical protein AFK69_01405 [Xenorhabdus sp. GDc328]
MIDIARVRRESLRWSLLVALNKTRPYTASETLLLDISRAIYPDVTALELRKELDYLADRQLIDLNKQPSGSWFADLTRIGVDVVEYTVDRPYWMYTGINDSHTRKSHLALHGRVFRYDDPFWQAFYPPNGWRCRCSVIALSDDDITARGIKVASSRQAMGWELKLVSQKTGEMQSVATFNTGTTKVATDVGWSYSPGAAYRPDLNRYQGALSGLARRELGGQNE